MNFEEEFMKRVLLPEDRPLKTRPTDRVDNCSANKLSSRSEEAREEGIHSRILTERRREIWVWAGQDFSAFRFIYPPVEM